MQDQKIVAVAYDVDGVYDGAYCWQTGQALALEGYRVVAVADDGYMSIGEAQALYDAELDRYADCFRFDPPPTPDTSTWQADLAARVGTQAR